ncbi:response regulator transcription factor [Mangrovitalea sediminis]|uniref:response regulator transcription factor n=1 Tax=Mangrovitalea sediminis TaxID=1982043 RepID=UPI000BE6193C|nr:response regulator [Mangrovitalea sediminis]
MLSDTPWLLIDDDRTFLDILARSLRRQGIDAHLAHDPETAITALAEQEIARCVLDLNLAGDSGLALLPKLLAQRPGLDVVVITGYGSIATAVEAMRRGAVNYLCKPVTVAQLMEVFSVSSAEPPLRQTPPSVEELEWEHIQQVLQQHDGNISATSRALNMHRRTLQRKLQKRSRWRQ